jgi:glycosidase
VRGADTGDLWWKNAVFYCADIETFYDWNRDGIGDIRGMTDRIEYLCDLGVTCLWLMPFYPTARKDDGYDITDFFGVDPKLGNLGDFVELVRTARSNGIRVIVDFVMNHTSDAHPWFQASRSDPTGPYGDFYVWNDDDRRFPEARIIFVDTEPSNWTFDPVRKQYFWHRFFSHQPDLNFDSAGVQEAILDALRFWLDLGIDGFRLDVYPGTRTRTGRSARATRRTPAPGHDRHRRQPPLAARLTAPAARGCAYQAVPARNET